MTGFEDESPRSEKRAGSGARPWRKLAAVASPLLACLLLIASAPDARAHEIDLHGPGIADHAVGTESDWAPPPADPDAHDWIQLTSGEWLKGKIRLIRDDEVSFDSDKLDDETFDWEDISKIVSAREHTYRFTGRRIVTGTVEMRGNEFRIRVGSEVQKFKKGEFVSMIPGSGREIDYWALQVGIGLSGQSGNTEQLSVNANLDLARKTPLTQTYLTYTGNVATQQSDVSANNHRITTGLDVYLTSRFYVMAPRFEAFQDEFQNIRFRLTPAVGVGYEVVDLRTVRLEMGIAAGYQRTQFLSTIGGDDNANDAAIQYNMSLNFDFPKRFEWDNSYQLQLIATDIDKTNQHVVSTFSFDLWGPVDLDATVQWDWVNQPQINDDGDRPDSSDFRISLGFGLDL